MLSGVLLHMCMLKYVRILGSILHTYILLLLSFTEIPGFLYDRETNRYYRITSNPAQSPSGVSLANKAKGKAKLNNDHEKKTKSSVNGSRVPVTIEMSHSPLMEKLRWSRNDVSVDMTKLLILREYQQLGLTQSKR